MNTEDIKDREFLKRLSDETLANAEETVRGLAECIRKEKERRKNIGKVKVVCPMCGGRSKSFTTSLVCDICGNDGWIMAEVIEEAKL